MPPEAIAGAVVHIAGRRGGALTAKIKIAPAAPDYGPAQNAVKLIS
jgi:hypothetical protein